MRGEGGGGSKDLPPLSPSLAFYKHATMYKFHPIVLGPKKSKKKEFFIVATFIRMLLKQSQFISTKYAIERIKDILLSMLEPVGTSLGLIFYWSSR